LRITNTVDNVLKLRKIMGVKSPSKEDAMDIKELGHQVLRRRKEVGFSQEVLAQKAEISRNYLSLIERGEAQNVSVNILNRLATALGTAPAALTGQAEQNDTLIHPTLRQVGLEAGLSFEIVDKLSRIPRRGKEPKTVDEWKILYEAIRDFLDDRP
jgi:transcriptional regulator with XRE-family HTH domain